MAAIGLAGTKARSLREPPSNSSWRSQTLNVFTTSVAVRSNLGYATPSRTYSSTSAPLMPSGFPGRPITRHSSWSDALFCGLKEASTVAQVDRVLRITIEVRAQRQPRRGNSADHGAVAQHG